MNDYVEGYDKKIDIIVDILDVKRETAKSYVHRAPLEKKQFGGQFLLNQNTINHVEEFVKKRGENYPTVEEVQKEIKDKILIKGKKIIIK